MDMKQWVLHDIEICSICFFQVLRHHPKPILKELFNLQLWSWTFFQHVTVLFPLYTFFKFLESFAIECFIKDWVFTKWKQSFTLSINIVWKDYSIFIFSKVVSCSWRCWYHRPKTIIKWTCHLILTSSPIFDWGFFGHLPLLERVLKNRVCLSFHPSFRLSVTFLGIGSLFFSET